MTSFATSVTERDLRRPNGQHQFTFRIRSQVYHNLNTIEPNAGQQPSYIQVYFLGGPQEQNNLRQRVFTRTDRNVLNLFQELFDRNNNLIRSFKNAMNDPGMQLEDARIIIRGERIYSNLDPRQLNAPVQDEVAIVLVNGSTFNRDIILRRRGGMMERIKELHPSYDALQYPLIFWEGNLSH